MLDHSSDSSSNYIRHLDRKGDEKSFSTEISEGKLTNYLNQTREEHKQTKDSPDDEIVVASVM